MFGVCVFVFFCFVFVFFCSVFFSFLFLSFYNHSFNRLYNML